jgi:hypothetical protein
MDRERNVAMQREHEACEQRMAEAQLQRAAQHQQRRAAQAAHQQQIAEAQQQRRGRQRGQNAVAEAVQRQREQAAADQLQQGQTQRGQDERDAAAYRAAQDAENAIRHQMQAEVQQVAHPAQLAMPLGRQPYTEPREKVSLGYMNVECTHCHIFLRLICKPEVQCIFLLQWTYFHCVSSNYFIISNPSFV